MVIAKVAVVEDRIDVTPISLVMKDALFILDCDDLQERKHSLKSLLSGRINKLMGQKRRLIETESAKSTTLSQLICEPVLKVMKSLVANGRLQPTDTQIKQLQQQQKLCEDGGLLMLSTYLKQLLSDTVSVKKILKVTYLCQILMLLEVEMPISDTGE